MLELIDKKSNKIGKTIASFLKREINSQSTKCVCIYYWQRWSKDLVFCYQNCPDLLWEKIVLFSDREFFLKFEAEGREFANFLRSLDKFIQTVKGQNNFGNRMLVPGGFSYLKN